MLVEGEAAQQAVSLQGDIFADSPFDHTLRLLAACCNRMTLFCVRVCDPIAYLQVLAARAEQLQPQEMSIEVATLSNAPATGGPGAEEQAV